MRVRTVKVFCFFDWNVMRNDPDHRVAAASVEEYMTMVAGGLAGATPHMISATVTAISRLVFEFKGS